LAFACPSANQTTAIGAIKNGLEVTCAQLPYLKGYVCNAEQQGGRLAISWSEQGPTPPFQEIGCPTDSEIPSYALLKREGLPLHYLQPSLCPVTGWVAASFPDGNAPVLTANYTRLDGGLLLCLCVHHSVMDGTGLGKITSLWGGEHKGRNISAAARCRGA
jgi:trichothecene 3-O-acetyltransferase